MKKRIYFIFFLGALVVLGCIEGNIESHYLDEFRYGGTLEGIEILPDEEAIISVLPFDNYLLVNKYASKRDELFKIYDHNLNLVSKFGSIGNGPNEFPRPIYSMRPFKFQNRNVASFIFPGKIRYTLIDIDSSMVSGSTHFHTQLDLPNKLFGAIGADEIFRVGNEIAGLYYDQSYKLLDETTGLYIYDIESSEMSIHGLTNLSLDKNDADLNSNLNIKFPLFSSDRGMVYVYSPYSFRYDSYNMLLKESNAGQLWGEGIDGEFRSDLFEKDMYDILFDYGFSTEDFVYLKYINTPVAELTSDVERSILIYDWDLKPMCRYTIGSEYDINSFSISDDNRTLYGVAMSTDKVFRFNINPERCSL